MSFADRKKIQNSTVIRYLANELAGAPKIPTNGQSGYEANTDNLTAFFVGNAKRLLTQGPGVFGISCYICQLGGGDLEKGPGDSKLCKKVEGAYACIKRSDRERGNHIAANSL